MKVKIFIFISIIISSLIFILMSTYIIDDTTKEFEKIEQTHVLSEKIRYYGATCKLNHRKVASF